MGNKFDQYLGRNVRLKESTFRKVSGNANGRNNLENVFVVATVTPGKNKLICYGANTRVTVPLSEVVMV